jgi:hypothetical protein
VWESEFQGLYHTLLRFCYTKSYITFCCTLLRFLFYFSENYDRNWKSESQKWWYKCEKMNPWVAKALYHTHKFFLQNTKLGSSVLSESDDSLLHQPQIQPLKRIHAFDDSCPQLSYLEQGLFFHVCKLAEPTILHVTV